MVYNYIFRYLHCHSHIMNSISTNLHFPTLFKCNIYGKQKDAALEFIKVSITSSFIWLDIFFDLPFTPDDIHQILAMLLPCQFTMKHVNIQWCLDPDGGINLDDSDYISGITLAPLLEFCISKISNSTHYHCFVELMMHSSVNWHHHVQILFT